ncbi:MAG TPA: hypothetical protein VGD89_09110 [Flavipsychrobacter sp.]
MYKEITISLQVNNNEEHVDVSYCINVLGEIQTISCKVKSATYNSQQWLHIRSFELKSEIEGLLYTPLFVDNSNIKNYNDSAFIDKAYNVIMAKENFILM